MGPPLRLLLVDVVEVAPSNPTELTTEDVAAEQTAPDAAPEVVPEAIAELPSNDVADIFAEVGAPVFGAEELTAPEVTTFEEAATEDKATEVSTVFALVLFPTAFAFAFFAVALVIAFAVDTAGNWGGARLAAPWSPGLQRRSSS